LSACLSTSLNPKNLTFKGKYLFSQFWFYASGTTKEEDSWRPESLGHRSLRLYRSDPDRRLTQLSWREKEGDMISAVMEAAGGGVADTDNSRCRTIAYKERNPLH
jgi:hypothetical protein